jgi:hypothetical protein
MFLMILSTAKGSLVFGIGSAMARTNEEGEKWNQVVVSK